MLRRRENPIALTAGILAVLVHGLFFILMVVSFNWKHATPAQEIAQVELWDTVPKPHVPEPKPEPKPEPPPPPPKPEPKPEPPPAPKAEIQLKAKPPAPEAKKPPKVEPKKPAPTPKVQDDEKKHQEALRKLQEELLKDDKPVDRDADKAIADAKAAAEAKRLAEAQAASSGIVNDYKARIAAKIKRNVNKQLCGEGKPELRYAIALMPTGELNGTPRFINGNATPACIQAVERAILQSQPLPLPPQPELFAQLRDLTLTFRPNDDQ